MLSCTSFREASESPNPFQGTLDSDFSRHSFRYHRYNVEDMLKSEYFDAHASSHIIADEETHDVRKLPLIVPDTDSLDYNDAGFPDNTSDRIVLREAFGARSLSHAHPALRGGETQASPHEPPSTSDRNSTTVVSSTTRPLALSTLDNGIMDAHSFAHNIPDAAEGTLSHLSELSSLDGSTHCSTHPSSTSSPSSQSGIPTSSASGAGMSAAPEAVPPTPSSTASSSSSTSSFPTRIDAILADLNNDMSERALAEQAHSQASEVIRQCEAALSRNDLPPEQIQDIYTQMQEKILLLEAKENQLAQIRTKLMVNSRSLSQCRQSMSPSCTEAILHVSSSIAALEESIQSFAIPYTSRLKWASMQSLVAPTLPSTSLLPPNTVLPQHAPIAFAPSPYEANWNLIPPQRRYSEQDVPRQNNFDHPPRGYPPLGPIPSHYQTSPHIGVESFRGPQRRSSMPDMGTEAREFGFASDPWRGQSRATPNVGTVSVWSRHPERTEVTMDANMILVRPFIDDEVARYQSRVSLLPFLRDPNYNDDEEHPLYSVHHPILGEEPQELPELRFGALIPPDIEQVRPELETTSVHTPGSTLSSTSGGLGNISDVAEGADHLASVSDDSSGFDSSTLLHPPPQRKRSRPFIDESGDSSMQIDPPLAKRVRPGFVPTPPVNNLEAVAISTPIPPNRRYSGGDPAPLRMGAGGEFVALNTPQQSSPWEQSASASGQASFIPKRSSSRDLPILDLSDLTKPFTSASTLKPRYIAIGTWHEDASDSMSIVAKFHHSKKRLVWQLHDSNKGAALRVLLNYGDVSTMTVHDVSVANSSLPYVAINFSLNSKPKITQEAPAREHRRSPNWVKVDPETVLPESTVLPQVHTLIFEKRLFTERHKPGLSQFEKLILGDPYFARIVRIDSKYPPLGNGFCLVGRRCLEGLRDKLIAFFEMLHKYVSLYSMPQLSLSVNFDVHHTFKVADNTRVESKPHEKAIAINFEDIHAIAVERNDPLISREEIQYYTGVTKIGENGICSFRHQGNVPTKHGGKLSAKHLVPLAQLQHVAPIQTSQGGAQFGESFICGSATPQSLYDRELTGPLTKRRRSSKNGRGSDQPKNIRVAMMFSKQRLIQVCGPEIANLWLPFVKSNSDD